ncbi:hypothetical protein [Actinokineospora terrae]|nr:hypothetical protein [Actinokineospora terrae]
MTYGESPSRSASCLAAYAGQAHPCLPNFGSNAHLSVNAAMTDGLGLTRAQFDLAAAKGMPWWRLGSGMPIVVPFMVFVLPLAAALVVGFSRREPTAKARLLLAATTVGWVAVLAFTNALGNGLFGGLLVPAAMVGTAVVMAWQWALTRPAWRVGLARGVVAYLAATVPCVVALIFSLVGGGYVD